MKFLSLLLAIVCLSISNLTHAQNQIDLNELLSRLDQNHMGAVTDVFTQSELTVLKAHLNEVNGITSETSETSGPVFPIFGPENQGPDFGFIDANAPSVFNILGPSGTNDFDGAGTTFPGSPFSWALDNSGWFYQVDNTNGTYALVGVIAPPPGESFTGLEFNTVDGKLFAVSSDGTTGTSHISEIDPVGLTATPIGNTGLMVPIALAIDGTGNAFTYDIDDDILYALNLATGNATAVGPIGFDASFGQGMTYDSVNDRILMTALNNSILDTELRSVNTTTGATTLIGQVEPGTITQMAWAGIGENGLGIEDNQFLGFSFFPNPVIERLTLNALGEIDSVKLYSIVGQEVINSEINKNTAIVDISFLSPGMYVMTVSIEGIEATYKIIKQ